MNCKAKTLLKKSVTGVFLLMILIFFAGCASSQMAAKQTEKGPAEPMEPKLITEISTSEDSESFMVWIKGNQLLTYTSVKQPVPLGVLLYFPETALGDINTTLTPPSDIVGPINASELTDKGHTARIEIALQKDMPYEVTREDLDLKISFSKASADLTAAEQELKTDEGMPVGQLESAPVAKSTAAATRLESISSAELENNLNVFINADGTISDYKSFTTTNPARIIFDLFNINSPYKKEQTVVVDSKWVKTIRHYNYPDRLRVVLDTTDSYLSAYSAHPSEKGLLIKVGIEAEQAAAPAPVELRAEASAGEGQMVEVDDTKPAWVNRIDFSSEDAGKSTIIIGTTKKVRYKLKKIDDKKLLLNLFNTNIPDYRRRPLITTRFASAVDRITPFQTPKMKKDSMIAIELREPVPYVVEQVKDLLMLHFEASSIPPKALEEAKLPSWKKVIAQTLAEAKVAAPDVFEAAAAEAQPVGKFKGEKISLNFYETDIKNVFRILMDVSGKNFAIDKNVSGQVTLTFEKPVPWDQVLDLVLRMNSLGMSFEGDIVRIATLATLAKEKGERQAQFAAEQKLKDQKSALKPLETEYIPINYADASGDILPHIQPLLTEGRGSVTVDARNNQLIITDLPEIIEQARRTARLIDKVTPQVLIEARIVEATNTFTRDIGTQWQVTGEPASSTNNPKMGGDLSFDMSATNPPASALGSLGISFLRTSGSQISVVNAQIQAAETNGLLKIISSPKVLTLDNTAATIKSGLDYPYNKLDADGNTTTEFKSVALELEVTPHVTPDRRVSMEITVKNNEIGSVYNNQQSFTTKEASTKLLVNDGDTIIIGGIRKNTKRDDITGVPGLKDIPLLGWLFKRKNKVDETEELLIFITPRIYQLEQRTMDDMS